jgi:hypothetical protein
MVPTVCLCFYAGPTISHLEWTLTSCLAWDIKHRLAARPTAGIAQSCPLTNERVPMCRPPRAHDAMDGCHDGDAHGPLLPRSLGGQSRRQAPSSSLGDRLAGEIRMAQVPSSAATATTCVGDCLALSRGVRDERRNPHHKGAMVRSARSGRTVSAAPPRPCGQGHQPAATRCPRDRSRCSRNIRPTYIGFVTLTSPALSSRSAITRPLGLLWPSTPGGSPTSHSGLGIDRVCLFGQAARTYLQASLVCLFMTYREPLCLTLLSRCLATVSVGPSSAVSTVAIIRPTASALMGLKATGRED